MAAAAQTHQDVFWAEHLDAGQQAALKRLRDTLEQRELLVDGHRDDLTLCRFLKARKWEPEKAMLMYQDMLEWRRTYLTPPDPPFETHEIKKNHPHFYHKTDHFGRPVYYELIGDLNLPEVLKLCDIPRLIRLHCSGWEKVRSVIFPCCSVAAGRDIYTCVTVLDLKGLKMTSFTKDTREFIAEIARIDQNYFPEHLGQMFIVNAPLIFRAIWAVVCPWLEPRTQIKIQVISSEKASQQALLAAIPAHNLIKRLGGTSEADPLQEEGPWCDEQVRDKAARSTFRHVDSTLTASTLSADTAVELGAW